MKNCLAVILSLALFVTMAVGPTFADGLIGNFETDIPIYGLSDLSVRTFVSRYFVQRKAYL